jgi:hypothetical protein
VTRLEPVLVRLPPEIATAVRALSRRTRIRLADHYREAFSDLLRKYDALPPPPQDERSPGGA